MSSTWSTIWTGVAADAIYTVLAASVASLIALFVVGRRRRRLFRFFGIRHNNSQVQIYLSRVEVLEGGSKGTDKSLNHGFTGPAIAKLEYQGALEVKQLLQSPLLNSLPSILRSILEGRANRITSADVSIEPSPQSEYLGHIFEQSNDVVMLLGSDVYSHAVRYVYQGEHSFLQFVSETSGLPYHSNSVPNDAPTFAVRSGSGSWSVIPARSIGREVGTIQRVTLDSGRQLLMCAGISASTTFASTKYLCSRWQSLADRFGTDDFLVVLGYPKQQADSDELQSPSELSQYERHKTPS